MLPYNFGPRVDGDFIPEEPSQLLRTNQHQNIDIISGVTADEGGFFTLREYFCVFVNSVICFLS